MIPVFITSRDRPTPLQALVEWLEKAGHEDIFIIDNASTYPPLCEWYESTPHTVLRMGDNVGPYAFWQRDVRSMTNTQGVRFILTDADVIPDPDCPMDAVEHFVELMARHQAAKVGFGLRIDDLPDHYVHKDAVLADEPQYWTNEVEPGAFWALLDTTFALYEPWATAPAMAIRTAAPYVARHDTWYQDSENLTEEQTYYRDHARYGSGWSVWGAR